MSWHLLKGGEEGALASLQREEEELCRSSRSLNWEERDRSFRPVLGLMKADGPEGGSGCPLSRTPMGGEAPGIPYRPLDLLAVGSFQCDAADH